jgi:hypothetical protein
MTFDQESLIRSISVAGLKKYMLFFGAGTSASSGIPTAGQCVWQWKHEIYLSKHPHLKSTLMLDATLPAAQDRIQRWLDRQGTFPKRGSASEYSRYIEYAYPRNEDRRRYFDHLFAGATPQIGYQLLAILQNSLVFQWIWTTNFDGLVRQSRTPKQTTPLKEAGLDTTLRIEGFDDLDDASYLVYLHGDYRYDELRNTTPEIANLDDTLRKKMIEKLRKRPMIFLGYGGWDESIMSTLEEAVSENSSGGGLYWCVSTGQRPNERSERLLGEAKRKGYDAEVVEIEHFDDFMVRVARFALRSRAEISDVEDLLAIAPPSKSAMRLPDNKPKQDWLKSNGFPLVLPTSLYQCDVPDITGWAELRQLVGDRMMHSGLLRGKVLTLGAVEDIRAAFGQRIKSEIDSVPLSDEDFGEDSVVSGILLRAITRTLAAHCNANVFGRQTIAERDRDSTENTGGVQYSIHKAAIIEIAHIGGKVYLNIIPDIITVAPENGDVPGEVRKEMKRRRLSRQWNKAYYDEVERWKEKIFGSEQQMTLRFPAFGTHDFQFTIHAPARYAQLLEPRVPRQGEIESKNGVEFNAIIVNEPQLRFGNDRGASGLDAHPMRGLVHYGPYDADLVREERCGELRVGIIAPKSGEAELSTYLRQLQNPHTAVETKAEYLVQYPGFQKAFRLPLNLPSIGSPEWRTLPAITLDAAQPRATQKAIISAIEREVEALRASAQTDVIIVMVPVGWKLFEKLFIEDVRHDLHDYVKAFCVQRGISTQFLREETFAKTQQCEVLWWLAQSLYVKSLRTPYILDGQDAGTVFVGIGYGMAADRNRGGVVLGCSHLYDAAGQGLRYVLSRINQPIWRNRNPYLSRDDAIRVGLQARQLFWDTYFKLPERVVLHKRTPFLDAERDGFAYALKGVAQLEMLTFEYENAWRFLAYNARKREVDGFPVRRGTVMPLSDEKCLLWVHGGTTEVHERGFVYFQGKSRIPVPLRITRFMGHTPLQQIATEVLGLSKMDWNSFDLYSQMPATLESSGAIASIGQLLSRFGPEMYDYRLFM